MTLKKWKLLSKKDISPSKWFPLESRQYQLPNGKIVHDFTVTTLADVAMMIPITKQRQIVMIKQFKPGIGEILTQFPAGRIEKHHQDMLHAAQSELEEETGIKAEVPQFKTLCKLHAFATKATEVVHLFIVTDCEFNSKQNLDELEDIEVITLEPTQIDKMIMDGKIWDAEAIAGWELVKKKYPNLL